MAVPLMARGSEGPRDPKYPQKRGNFVMFLPRADLRPANRKLNAITGGEGGGKRDSLCPSRHPPMSSADPKSALGEITAQCGLISAPWKLIEVHVARSRTTKSRADEV